ncbi:PREDICTED: GTPase-activating protein CdGAPr-like isoform X1 [Ceratosolen solmsi marchali]|uniref:GTPase-activating protein CdGAPr-like isoform X1 n=1 Tax=Ceratosolen solmsi marchali TaxID=326594 RepID=A0AAJ6YJ75_9HYME|nr:PREDICTED: GTPase-activating protein CdGAPr-like isoform X1 [Ceratosolen solmsi marchali]
MKRLHRMPGASLDRARACKLTELEPRTVKGSEGCNSGGGSGGSRASGRGELGPNEMGSVARFPKLDECAHFHYEHVELGQLEVSMAETGEPDSFTVRVTSGDACWTLQRSREELLMLDRQLHRCIFDREFSMLPDLEEEHVEAAAETLERLRAYLRRFSELSHEGLNCGPVLNWLQLDNRGRRILVPEADSCPINTPAVAAAYAVRPYRAQAQDELSFQIGDMISVIDMPPAGESSWWRGKLGFAVGFFPAECVAVFGDKLPRRLALATSGQQPHERLQPGRLQPVKPVLRKHGKLIAFFRSFILNRPSRRRLKQSGILRERVFGCDLGEHLLNSGREVPCVLSCCAEFIERHGLVDGIYRLSGVASNIQRLRHAFDEDRPPTLQTDGGIRQDIHSVASLLKMYFRELPNPLCTYQLYAAFVGAVRPAGEAERLRRMREAVRELPPPHYRTLEYLVRHLERVAARGDETGMTARNLAIVWAPNLLRSKELELAGVAALQGVGVQAVVTEFLIRYAELVFAAAGQRPKSLAVAAGSKRLLSLEEARNRSLPAEPALLEVGAGSAGLPARYHTIIELPPGGQPRRRGAGGGATGGSKRSPSLNWRALFGGRQAAKAHVVPEPRLRPVKSADSLEGLPEDGLGPLPMGPTGTRSCGHSRSVSHDSYFEQLGEQSTELPGLEGPVPGLPGAAGSRRKRSRLEERLQCEAELRFIDSQSPDQVMLSADVHEMESPSPLPTPGYLPLLSEGSTPITPTKGSAPLEPLDQEMRPCERLLGGTSIVEFHRLDCIPSRLHREEPARKIGTVVESPRGQPTDANNSNLSSSQSMTDLDSLMTYEQSYQYSSNSNFIPLDPREKVTSFSSGQAPNYVNDLRNANKWLMTDLPSDTISPSNGADESQLHRIAITKNTQMLAVEECSSGSSTPKSCQESMCYSVSDGTYNCEGNAQSTNSNFDSPCEDSGSNVTQNRNSDQVDQTEMLVSMKISQTGAKIIKTRWTNPLTPQIRVIDS